MGYEKTKKGEYQHFEVERSNSFKSSKIILPMVLDLIKPKSMIDVGCAMGEWMITAKEWGVENLMGIDGEYARKGFRLSPEQFIQMDLNDPQPVGRRFDLAMSTEVAEHIREENAVKLVKFLTSLSDNILFAAAVPGQDGDGHINEQWNSWWAKIFESEGYYPHDVVRPKVWNNKDVGVWFVQNTLLYTKEKSDLTMIDVIHPELYTRKMNSRVVKLVRRLKGKEEITW